MEVLNKAKIDIQYAFGIYGPIRENILVVNDELIFPVGNHVAVYNSVRKDKSLEFFDRDKTCSSYVSALALAPNKKILAACFNETNTGKGAQIHFFNIADRHHLCSLLHKNNIQSIVFSNDSNQVITASEKSLIVWNWEKGNITFFSSISGSITRLSCPFLTQSGDLLFSATGLSHFRLWTASSSQQLHDFVVPQLQSKEHQYNFPDHCWLRGCNDQDSNILAVIMEPDLRLSDRKKNDDTAVVIYQLYLSKLTSKPTLELKQTVSISTCNVLCLSSLPSAMGFYLGGTEGFFSVFKRNESCHEEYEFLSTKLLQKSKENIIYISSGCDESEVFLFSESMRVFTYSLNTLYKSEDNNDEISSVDTFREHPGEILDSDCCVEKPLIVTCNSDHSVRVWNYRQYSCDIVHQCGLDGPHSVAIHPSGYQLLVGFKDRVIMFHILTNSLEKYREVICKTCQSIQFSPGGGYFAMSSRNSISVYKSYNSVHSSDVILICSFNGHVGPVYDFVWSSDATLISVGKDGYLRGWDISEGSLAAFHVFKKPVGYIKLVVTSDRTGFHEAAVCTDGILYKVSWNMSSKDITSTFKVDLLDLKSDGIEVICLNEKKTLLFAGTVYGSIRCYQWPLTSSYDEMHLHSMKKDNSQTLSSVNCIKSCNNVLISGGVDGSLFISNFEASNDDKESCESLFQYLPMSSCCSVTLVSLEYYQGGKEYLMELEQTIKNMKNDHEYHLHNNNTLWDERLKSLSKKKNEVSEDERKCYEELQTKYQQSIKNHSSQIKAKDLALLETVRDLEENYDCQLNLEKKKNESLKKHTAEIKGEVDSSMKQQQILYENKIRFLEQDFEKIKKKMDSSIASLKQESHDTEKIFREILDQQEEEYEMELQKQKALSEASINEQYIRSQQLQGMVQSMKSRKDHLTCQNHELKSKTSLIEDGCQKEILQRKEMQSELDKNTDKIHKVLKNLASKEKKILQLVSEKNTLENARYAAEDRINDLLKKEIPRKKKLNELEKEIVKLKLDKSKRQKSEMSQTSLFSQQNMKIEAKKKEITSLQLKLHCVKREFTNLVNLENSEMKKKVNILYQKYIISQSEGIGINSET